MAYYSYFAYAVMMITLFMAIKYCVEGFYLRKQLRKEFLSFEKVLSSEYKVKSTDLISIPVRFYINQINKRRQISLKEQTADIFSSLLLKLSSMKSIAPAMGLCFTVLSIMCSFHIFSTTGDIKAMFQAASVGLGTTAMGAITIVVSKLMIDRVLLPLSIETLHRFEAQVSTLERKINNSNTVN